MPRNRRLRDYLMRRDYRGGYGMSDRRGRMDMGMDYEYDERRGQDNARGRRDYARRNQGDMHYSERQGNFRPVEAMGYFTGYYGGGQDMARNDYARGRNRDYGDYEGDYRDYEEDMARGGRGGGRGRDYNADYGYYDAIDSRRMDMHHYPPMMWDYAGDYGEKLSKSEIEHWHKRLMGEVDEKDKQFLTKENIANRAKQMGIEFDKFTEDELALVTAMVYTDYCKTLGTGNMDLYIRLAKDWICDDDVAVKYGEKIAVYHDCVVKGE